MDKVPNAPIRDLSGVTKGVTKRLMKVFSNGRVKRMENDRIAKMVYVGECADSCSMGKLPKRWIDTVRYCLKKRGLEVR